METPAAELPRGTVTFLFTDIEGSTELTRMLGEEFGRLRSEHHRVLREAIAAHGGHEIDTAGDGFFVVFASARDGVAAAVAAQRALTDGERWQTPVRVRMGLHSAEPYFHEGSYVGIGVHRAARICAAGHGGQIVLSNATAGIIEDLGLEGVRLLDLGEHELKDIERPQRLFQLVVDGLPAEFPPLKSLDRPSGPAVVSLLFTDLVGWGAVMRRLGDEHSARIAEAHAGVITTAVAAENGRVVEIVGDSTVSRFHLPGEALRAAAAIRSRLQTEQWFPEGDPPAVSMAVHSGRVADLSSRYLGSVAMNCGLLCGAAEPNQILVSQATHALVEGELLNVELRDLGERDVRGFERPVRLFEVV